MGFAVLLRDMRAVHDAVFQPVPLSRAVGIEDAGSGITGNDGFLSTFPPCGARIAYARVAVVPRRVLLHHSALWGAVLRARYCALGRYIAHRYWRCPSSECGHRLRYRVRSNCNMETENLAKILVKRIDLRSYLGGVIVEFYVRSAKFILVL